jgi:integrase
LRCEDVKQLDGVWCFSLEEHAGRRLKTASSRRVVTVHSALIEAGLLEYVERQRQQGQGRLFPTLRADAFGNVTNAWGKYYSRWSRKIVPDRRKVAHSWRHTVVTKLRQAGVGEDVMDALLGWQSLKMNRRYGSGHTVATGVRLIE